MRLKGTMVLELTDVNTLEVETVTEENMITNAVNYILGINPMGIFYAATGEYDDAVQWNGTLLPICPNMIGGILLFSNTLEEDADNIYQYSANMPVAYASNNVNSTANLARGSLNLTESKALDNGYKFVWEFTPSQGNGTIAAIALTSALGGQNGYGSLVGDASTFLRLKAADIGDIPKAKQLVLFEAVEVDFEKNLMYSISFSNSAVLIKKVRVPVLDIGLNEKLDDSTYTVLEEQAVQTSTFRFLGSYTLYGEFFDGKDGYWYGFSNEGNSSGNAAMVWVKIAKEDYSVTEGEWTLSNAKLMDVGNRDEENSYPERVVKSCMRNGYLYVPAYNKKGIYKINVSNSADVTLIEFSFTSKWKPLCETGSCELYMTLIGDIIVAGDFQVLADDTIVHTQGSIRLKNAASPLFQYKQLNFTGGMVTLREYQQAMASVDQEIEAEKMENAIGRANENLYLGGYDDRYAIYQIHPDGKGRAYQFMGMDFVTSHQLSVEGMDYRFIYGGRLSAKDTLDSLYDRFNLNHPESYEGHSLSVSDVIIMQRNHQAQAYYVDSFGFKELPEFVLQRQKEVEKERAREDSLVNEDTTGLEVEQHEGTWHTVEAREIGDEMFYRMEHDTYGDSVSSIIVNADGDLVAQDLEHGFDRDAMEAIREYFSEKGVEWESETAPDAVQPEAAWNKKTYPPVVYEGAVVALEKGMIEEYRDSWKLNVACKDAIEDAIRNNFDGMHLAPDVIQPVLEEYGQERLTYLLVSTLRQKREDGRFSRDNKAWAEDYTFDGERNIVLSPDFLVDSHPAVLNGFIDLARDEFEALEKMADRENEEPFISRYFVVNDAYGIKEEREYQYFEDFSGAFAAYHMLPNHFDKQIGMESTEQPPSRMTLIRCENGVETLENVEANSLSGKWLKPDVLEAVNKAETYLKEWDTELAYQIKNGERYFFIQTTSGGYDYTFYDKEFKELDGGVYDDPDISIQEAIEEILSDEDGVSFSDCKVIDCDKLWETVERAEYFPQKAYEDLRELMDSDADEAAFQCGYGYVSIQKVPEGYEYISYDSEWKEIGGDLYDIPEATMEDVVTWIFKDEGLGDLDCKPIDYEEVVQGTLRSAKERLAEDKLTPTSQISRRETALGENSRHDIEETVLCYAQAELEEMGLSDEVKLLAARVYGSRLREGLYTEKSDVDVVLSYSGDIREDAFFNALHEHGMEIGGLTVDINPISMEKTGTLEAYMEQAEKYLDGKEIEKLAVDLDTFSYDNDFYEYQDEVEDREQELQKLKQELMEGRTEPIKSYLQVFVDEGEPEETVSEAQHLIDRLCQAENRNLFHQEEQVEPSISFYVAECMEYPVMGEYHENLTLQEAYELYEKIPPERINGVKGIGFRLEDGSIYDGLFELMSGGTVIKDVINEIPHYKESPLVQKAIADMEAILADHGIQKAVEPEKEPVQAADRAVQEDGRQEKTTGSREEKMPETVPKVSNPAKEPGTGRKDSVLKALRERQAKLKTQEQEKQPKDKTQSRKKGEQDL